MKRNTAILSAKHFTVLAVGCVVFVIYGSLVPLAYQPMTWDEATSRFGKILGSSVSVVSRSDWLANILLFIPLGFAAMGALSVDRREMNPLHVLLVMVGCLLLSLGVEFAQLWFPPRNPSLNDIVAETSGGLLGVVSWSLFGNRLTGNARSFWGSHAAGQGTIRWLPVYLLLLVIFQGMPFDLTISPGELKQKWTQGRVAVMPFGGLSDDSLSTIRKACINMAYYFPAGILLAGMSFPRLRRASWSEVLLIGFVLAGAIEFMQVFVISRFADTTDVLTGGTAVCLAWTITRRLCKADRGLRIACLCGWSMVLVGIAWTPFAFAYPSEGLSQRLSNAAWIPFSDYYQGHYLLVFSEMVQKVVLFFPIGLLLSGRGVNGIQAIGFGLLLAMVQEWGQVFLPAHQLGVSDLFLSVIGVGLGMWMGRPIREERLDDSRAVNVSLPREPRVIDQPRHRNVCRS